MTKMPLNKHIWEKLHLQRVRERCNLIMHPYPHGMRHIILFHTRGGYLTCRGNVFMVPLIFGELGDSSGDGYIAEAAHLLH